MKVEIYFFPGFRKNEESPVTAWSKDWVNADQVRSFVQHFQALSTAVPSTLTTRQCGCDGGTRRAQEGIPIGASILPGLASERDAGGTGRGLQCTARSTRTAA